MKKTQKKSVTKVFDAQAELKKLRAMQGDSRNTTDQRNDTAKRADSATAEKLIGLLGKIPKSQRRRRISRDSWALLLTHLTGWDVGKNEIEFVVQKLDLRDGRHVRPPVSWITPKLIRRAEDAMRSEATD